MAENRKKTTPDNNKKDDFTPAAENNQSVNVENLENNSSSSSDLSHETLLNNPSKKQIKQRKFNREMQAKINEQSREIRSIRSKISKIEKEFEEIEEEDTSSESSDDEEPVGTGTTIMPATGKSFVMKHVFKNVSSMKNEERMDSENEENFGVLWKITVVPYGGWLVFYLLCEKSLEDEKWSIETKMDLKLISKSGKHVIKEMNGPFGNVHENVKFRGYGERKFIKLEEMMEYHVIDDELTVEVHVKINKMTGIYKDNLRLFDESMRELSDVVMIVQDHKFYVSKLTLASHSSYFRSMFLGNFRESKKSEIELSGIDADDFRKYLEVIYGESAIDEFTVEGILLVSDMYDTPIVIRKCEEFLLEKSKKSLKKKLEMATKYNLEQLKNKCMSEIQTIADIKSVLPGSIDDLDPSIMAELFKKSLELQ